MRLARFTLAKMVSIGFLNYGITAVAVLDGELVFPDASTLRTT
jgi:hypothetical protein